MLLGSRLARAVMLSGLALGGVAAAQPVEWPPVGAPTSEARTAGRWLWMDLATTDLDRSRAFYARVFNWEFRAVPGEDGSPAYLTILAQGQPIGGMVALRRDASLRGARWIGLASGDPATMSTRAKENGGSIVVEPRALPGRGELAVLADPEGARFGVLRAQGGDPSDHRGRVHEWLWIELWTPDPARAANFYREVFGYAVEPADRKGRSFRLAAGGRARAGVVAAPDPSLPAAWIPYVRVDDLPGALARAREGGARVVIEPRRHHRSQVAVLVDPLGAPFAMADWRPQ